MYYIDFHTHHVPVEQDVVAVVDGRDTWGVHPWDASSPVSFPGGEERVDSSLSGGDYGDVAGCLAIGECGLDALKGPDMSVQEQVFLQQIKLSEALEKPLVVHCVKAIDRLLSLRKTTNPRQPWMLHGFRGKPQQLRSLLEAGFYISFGFSHNDESLRNCPIDRLLLETDNQQHPIAALYRTVAENRGLTVAALCESMAENYRTFFRNEPLRA